MEIYSPHTKLQLTFNNMIVMLPWDCPNYKILKYGNLNISLRPFIYFSVTGPNMEEKIMYMKLSTGEIYPTLGINKLNFNIDNADIIWS